MDMLGCILPIRRIHLVEDFNRSPIEQSIPIDIKITLDGSSVLQRIHKRRLRREGDRGVVSRFAPLPVLRPAPGPSLYRAARCRWEPAGFIITHFPVPEAGFQIQPVDRLKNMPTLKSMSTIRQIGAVRINLHIHMVQGGAFGAKVPEVAIFRRPV